MTDPAFDPATGELIELPGARRIQELTERVEFLNQEVDRLEGEKRLLFKDNTQLRSRNTSLVRGRNSSKELDPFHDDAQECFELWRELLSPTARTFSGKRFDNPVELLRAGVEKERIFKAIRGAAKKPYVTNEGRSATGKPSERHADLELICRTEQHLDRFGSYAEDEEEPKNPRQDSEVAVSISSLHLVEEPVADPVRIEGVPVCVPDWPVTCERSCTHEQMLKALWPWWQFSGERGCPACSFGVLDSEGRHSDEWLWEAATPDMFGSKVSPERRLHNWGPANKKGDETA